MSSESRKQSQDRLRQAREERLVTDFVGQKLPSLAGFERAQDHDASVRALDFIKSDFRQLDQAEGEVGTGALDGIFSSPAG